MLNEQADAVVVQGSLGQVIACKTSPTGQFLSGRRRIATPEKRRAGNGGRVAYRFVTRSAPALTPYYRLFYAEGRKRVPKLELDSLALAVWLMDDGCRSRNAVYLNTQQFDEQS